MAALDKLPAEILLRILSLLPNIQDAAALSIQCRYLHSVVDMATRRRYFRLRVDGCHWQRSYNLLWKFLKRPILASLVKEIVSNEWNFPEGGKAHDDWWVPSPDEKDAPLLQSAIDRAGFTGDKAEKLMEMIMLLPRNMEQGFQNVRHIDFTRFSDNAARLEDKQVGFLHDNVPRNLNPLATHFPSVESVKVIGNLETGWESHTEFLEPGVSNIKRIHLRYSRTPPRELRWLIQHPRHLEVFEFSSGHLDHFPGTEDTQMHPKFFGRALICHKSTLQVLDLDVDDATAYPLDPVYDPYYEGEDYHDGEHSEFNRAALGITPEPRFATGEPDTRPYGQTIGSLRDFTAMKRLSINVGVLLGAPGNSPSNVSLGSEKDRVPIRLVDDLPPNLEYFRLRDYVPGQDPFYTNQVEEFMAKRDQWPPSLKEVHGLEECVKDLSIGPRIRNRNPRYPGWHGGEMKPTCDWGEEKWNNYEDELPPNLQEVPWRQIAEIETTLTDRNGRPVKVT
ncbi:hypothetical protein FQN54_000427 [Arachnomyces sp. PD_36]|nr:hypothetical protein FQN54_000427 [Arachnomyces sp. PD_36]